MPGDAPRRDAETRVSCLAPALTAAAVLSIVGAFLVPHLLREAFSIRCYGRTIPLRRADAHAHAHRATALAGEERDHVWVPPEGDRWHVSGSPAFIERLMSLAEWLDLPYAPLEAP